MNSAGKIDDLRLSDAQCVSLTPVRDVYANEWFSVRDRGGYFTVEYNRPQVIILPIIDDHSIVMVRVKRPILADNTWDLPAGCAETNETPLASAVREFAEETGIVIKDTQRFVEEAPISVSPNRTPTLIHVYRIVISQEEYDRKSIHDNEIECVKCYRIEEVINMLIAGEIYVVSPAAVISRYILRKCFN